MSANVSQPTITTSSYITGLTTSTKTKNRPNLTRQLLSKSKVDEDSIKSSSVVKISPTGSCKTKRYTDNKNNPTRISDKVIAPVVDKRVVKPIPRNQLLEM